MSLAKKKSGTEEQKASSEKPKKLVAVKVVPDSFTKQRVNLIESHIEEGGKARSLITQEVWPYELLSTMKPIG
ncbi:MAG: hypothetical protein P8N12_08730 [Porticoccaceae bacterium]|nr:hypothetical protein [Porticoccaceae bacterium]